MCLGMQAVVAPNVERRRPVDNDRRTGRQQGSYLYAKRPLLPRRGKRMMLTVYRIEGKERSHATRVLTVAFSGRKCAVVVNNLVVSQADSRMSTVMMMRKDGNRLHQHTDYEQQ